MSKQDDRVAWEVDRSSKAIKANIAFYSEGTEVLLSNLSCSLAYMDMRDTHLPEIWKKSGTFTNIC